MPATGWFPVSCCGGAAAAAECSSKAIGTCDPTTEWGWCTLADIRVEPATATVCTPSTPPEIIPCRLAFSEAPPSPMVDDWFETTGEEEEGEATSDNCARSTTLVIADVGAPSLLEVGGEPAVSG